MTAPAQGMIFRVFEGTDCEYRYVASVPAPSDHIVWGTHHYNLRVRWKPMSLLTVLSEIAKSNQRPDQGRTDNGGRLP